MLWSPVSYLGTCGNREHHGREGVVEQAERMLWNRQLTNNSLEVARDRMILPHHAASTYFLQQRLIFLKYPFNFNPPKKEFVNYNTDLRIQSAPPVSSASNPYFII